MPAVSSATQLLILTRESSGAPAKSTAIIPAPVVFGQHVEKIGQELIAMLTPDCVGDVQAEILTGFARVVGRTPRRLAS